MRSLRHIGICGLLGMILAAPAAGAATRTYPSALIDNRVFVDVRADGAGPFAFILDTGASGTTIDDTLMKRLKLKSAGGGQTGGAGEQTVGYETVHLKSLALGDLELGPLDATSLDGRPLAAIIGLQKFDGVLGDEVFAQHVVTIDVGKAELTVEDLAGFTPGPTAIRVPMALNSDQMPVIDAMIDGVAGRYVVDTGDRPSLPL